MGRSKKPKPPNGEEKKNQLDLFRWAAEAISAAATAAASVAVAAKDAATKTIEEMWAAFDKRCLALCGLQVPVLVAFSYRPPSAFTLVVVAAAGLSALLLVMPRAMRRIPSYTDRVTRVGSNFVTALFIISVFSLSADMMMSWFSSPPDNLSQQGKIAAPKAEFPPPQSQPDEKLLTEEAERDATTRAEKETARVAECLKKEFKADKANATLVRRERDYNKCKVEYDNAVLTLKSLDTYCAKERRRFETASGALRVAVADMCSSTGSTKKGR